MLLYSALDAMDAIFQLVLGYFLSMKRSKGVTKKIWLPSTKPSQQKKTLFFMFYFWPQSKN